MQAVNVAAHEDTACVGWPQCCGSWDAGRECKLVVTQISAATRALEQAGYKLVAAGLTYCLTNPEEAEASGYPLEVVEKSFLKLA